MSKDRKLWIAGLIVVLQVTGCGKDHEVELWELKATFSNSITKPSVLDAEFSPDGRWILAASSRSGHTGKVKIWDVETEQVVQEFYARGDVQYEAKFSPNQDSIVTVNSAKDVIVWSVESGAQVLELHANDYDVRTAEFSPDGSRIVTAGTNDYPRVDAIQVWDALSGSTLQTIGGRQLRDTRRVHAARFSPDGGRILTAAQRTDHRTSGGTLREWDSRSGRPIRVLTEIYAQQVLDAEYSSDGRLIVAIYNSNNSSSLESARRTQKVSVLDTESGRQQLTLDEHHTARIWEAGFNESTSRLLTASSDATARVWEVPSGKLLAVLEHPDEVQTASFSPNGNCLVTGCSDGNIRIWCRNVASGNDEEN